MAYICVCDLCGMPIKETPREFKIKERWYSWHESGWAKIVCHDECVKKLMSALQKEERMREGADNGNS